MGRYRRPDLPGVVFHLTARTIRSEGWFTPFLRTRALRVLAETLPRSGSRLLAAAVMSTHLHLVVQQGEKPLSHLMQPLLRRLALELQRTHALEGPVFWRQYGSQPCLDPSYARNAIVYTHLNPLRAGLCADPSEYPWTSHLLYAAGEPDDLPTPLRAIRRVLDPTVALRLFASAPDRTSKDLRGDYQRFLRWRLATDARKLETAEAEEPPGRGPDDAPTPPPEPWDRPDWAGRLSPLFHSAVRGSVAKDAPPAPAALDMSTLARATVNLEAPGLTVPGIRGRGGGRQRSRVRHAVIRRLHAAGYRNVQIARFLDLSESTVSWVLRRPPLPK